jgi:hypothetical protein
MPTSGAAWLSLARVVKRAVKSYKRAQPNFLVGLFPIIQILLDLVSPNLIKK